MIVLILVLILASLFPRSTDIMLGYWASALFHTSLFFTSFFFSDRPTQNLKTHSTIKEEKKGMALCTSWKNIFWSQIQWQKVVFILQQRERNRKKILSFTTTYQPTRFIDCIDDFSSCRVDGSHIARYRSLWHVSPNIISRNITPILFF